MKPSVNLNDILQHELLSLPLALAEMGGSFRTETKSILADVLLKKFSEDTYNCRSDIENLQKQQH